MLQCYLEPNCVSYNFHKIKQLQAPEKHKCELNNATIEHDGDLVKNKSYVYRGAEVRINSKSYKLYSRPCPGKLCIYLYSYLYLYITPLHVVVR